MATNEHFAELIQFLSTTRADLKGAVQAVPAELRDRMPAPDAWSVAQVLEHLAVVETRITQLLSAVMTNARAEGRVPDIASSIVHSIPLAVLRDRSRKIVARESNLPTRGVDAETAMLELDQARLALLALVDEAQRVDVSAARNPHAVFGDLNGYQWMALVGGHEARHTAQINEIANALSHSV